MTKKFVYFVCLILLLAVSIFPQSKEKNSSLIAQNVDKNCAVFLNGKLLNNPQPVYPTEAKVAGISGKVEVVVEIDETGKVVSVENVSGNLLLIKAASDAALQAKFSPTLCNGIPTKNVGVITFNFPQIVLTGEYFKTTKIEDFSDVTEDKIFYEAVSQLTVNYRIAFGYADQKFHGEMPLTRGDFANFLRQMLDMLDLRGKMVSKPIRKIGLYQSYNPYNLDKFRLDSKMPYAESLMVLLEKYDIILANKDGSFAGDEVLTQKDVVEIWRDIFGEEAVPVNFLDEKDAEKEMSRGDFAIYLKESLDVLSYKVLP